VTRDVRNPRRDPSELVLEKLLSQSIRDATTGLDPLEWGWSKLPKEELFALGRGVPSKLVSRRPDGMVRISVTNFSDMKSLRERFPSLGHPLEYLLDYQTFGPRDVLRRNRAKGLLTQAVVEAKKTPVAWVDILFLGWWRMIESNGVDAPLDRVLANGFSPKEWTVASVRAATGLAHDVSSLNGDESGPNGAARLLHDFSVRRNPDLDSSIDPPTLDRVKNVLDWQRFLVALPERVRKAFGLAWFCYLLWELDDAIPSVPAHGTEITAALEEGVHELTGLDGSEVDSVVEDLCRQGFTWADGLLTWPEILE
jgi:hypothetical protein